MLTLSERDIKIAEYLAQGLTQDDTAQRVGVSRSTVARLNRSEEFRNEVERRKHQRFSLSEDSELPIPEYEWDTDITQHVENLEKVADAFYKVGMSGAIKAARRIRDLPDEALKPSDAIALLKASKECIEFSVSMTNEKWGINDIAEERLKADDQAA